MENISRTHLQELFGSFPSNELDNDHGQENGSDDEYQIYEDDTEGNYSDEWVLTFKIVIYTHPNEVFDKLEKSDN